MDPCWSLPLWIPASAGMTKGAGMTFCIILYILQHPVLKGNRSLPSSIQHRASSSHFLLLTYFRAPPCNSVVKLNSLDAQDSSNLGKEACGQYSCYKSKKMRFPGYISLPGKYTKDHASIENYSYNGDDNRTKIAGIPSTCH